MSSKGAFLHLCGEITFLPVAFHPSFQTIKLSEWCFGVVSLMQACSRKHAFRFTFPDQPQKKTHEFSEKGQSIALLEQCNIGLNDSISEAEQSISLSYAYGSSGYDNMR
ncbi:MAG: hypothetical protein MI725_10830 [Pirellulales bacterium]|nr:hypothetical protein [Pirellulales bacterium]